MIAIKKIVGFTDSIEAVLYVSNHFSNVNIKNSLTSQEYLEWDSFPSDLRKNSFFRGRVCGKKALNIISSEFELTQWEIQRGIIGQPVVVNISKSSIRHAISISHSEEFAGAIAFNQTFPCGLDIESMNRNVETSTIASSFTSGEKNLIDSNDRSSVFRIWTAKEAISKIMLMGLILSLDIFEIKSIQKSNYGNYWTLRFKNFPLYKGISFEKDNCIITIAVHEQGKLL